MALSTTTPSFSIQANKITNYTSPIFLKKQALISIINGISPLYQPLSQSKPSSRRTLLTVPAFSSSQGVGALVGSESNLSLLDKALVFDLNGNGIPISDLWKDRKAVVAFARHFGCVFCRKRADYLASKKRSRSCNTICFAKPNASWSELVGKISISSAQTRTINQSGNRCWVPDSELQEEVSPPLPVKIVSICEDGSISPLKSAPWQDVLLHTAERLKWVDEEIEMLVFSDSLCQSSESMAENLKKELMHADILLVVSVTIQESVKWIQNHAHNVPNVICFESSTVLVNKLGGSPVSNGNEGKMLDILTGLSKSKKVNEKTEVVKTVTEAWERHNSDDIRFSLLVIINAYLKPVSVLKNLRSKGFSTLSCMVKNCGPQILNCLLDPACRNALQCLNKCSPVDQEQMDAAGVALILIGPGNIDQAKAFYEQTTFGGEVYADPNHSSYGALNFVSGASTTFTPKAGLKIIQLYMEGYRQDWGLSFQKDTVSRGGWQQGGIIVAGPGKTNISYIHKDKEAGDDPPIEDILKACCSYEMKS
ncbi:uncharacterized protein LOC110730376 isoform X2 [Chenopodium quinoa]|uniref:uncharacterized protein LOC110730376 isoform X2 n=1 Tax=Chenopodium quinoa TaxID=63459 RepID=UPI000B770C5A|nr:uncharacterized protein LOC110730376 isoform X2 [Chenopodium quinoa]